jgi:hypothetical protein
MHSVSDKKLSFHRQIAVGWFSESVAVKTPLHELPRWLHSSYRIAKPFVMSFGFSVGDIVAVGNLTSKSCIILRERHDAREYYCAPVDKLGT